MVTEFVVKTSSANMPSHCWGDYARVGVLEIDTEQTDDPKMISTHARGVVRVVQTWEKCNVGKTERCAFRRALAAAERLAEGLNNGEYGLDENGTPRDASGRIPDCYLEAI
jgi:hypothetical protein